MTGRPHVEHRPYWLAGASTIVAAAFAIRILHLFCTERMNPLAPFLQLDAATYDRWARALAFGGDPGPTTLMQAPLYPWFLAAIYKIFGPLPATARALQALLGTATAALIMYTTRRVFSSAAAALVAGALAALYAPLIFFEGLILPATLIVFLNALALALFAGDRRPGTERTLAGGTVLGAAIAANPPNVLLLPFVLLHLGLAGRGDDIQWPGVPTAPAGSSRPAGAPRPAPARGRMGFLRCALLLLAGVALALAPFTIRNYIRSGEFIPLTTGGGVNFYIGNNPGANGYYAAPSYGGSSLGFAPEEQWRRMTEIAREKSGAALGESDVSRFWFRAGLRWARAHPLEWTALAWQKFIFFWNRYERANVENFYFHRRFPGVLSLPLLTFGVVAPLGLLGIFLARGRSRRLWLLYGGALVYLATAVVFYVTARYRLPVLPFLVPLAAAAVVELVGIARRRRFAELALLAVALAVLALLSNFTVARDTPQGISANLVRLGDAYLSRGDTTRAGAAYLEALALDAESARAKERLLRVAPCRDD